MRMSRCALGVLCALVLVACAPANVSPPHHGSPPHGDAVPVSFPYQVADGRVALSWNCTRAAPNVVTVRGVARNPYYAQPIKNLTLTLYGINAQGAAVTQAQEAADAFLIHLNETTWFSVMLQTLGNEVRYDLAYSYTQDAGGMMSAPGDQRNLKLNACPNIR
jgi:hypothetical protein